MDKQFDLLVAGEINPDLILAGDVEPAFGQVEKIIDSTSLTIGSSSAIFACGAARLGLKVGFVGLCGDDLFGRFMLEQMQQRGVDTSPVIVQSGSATGLSVILNRGTDRAILTSPGVIPAFQADNIPENLLSQAGHLHVASYFLQTGLQSGLPDLFERARAAGMTTSLDTNYDPSESWSGLEMLLPLTNVFLPNELEICSLTGSLNARQAVERLAGKVETLAVKLGAQGALARQGIETIHVNSLPVKVVDTVGAGDTFDAGFIYGYIKGWPLEKSLRLAAVCGALSLQGAGGTTAQPTLAEAEAYLDSVTSKKV